ncbi:MAG: thiamine pyrophosphate-binding protein [Clostridia bacterium]|nr:thiamine pyrophosphate-binding protein [Clostridia bacterium]
MKVSDYIAEFFIEKQITDIFGYPGGMVTHLMDSFYKYKDRLTAHVNYHEQASAFSACGYAQGSGKVGVAYATSGPGATNLITGIAHAYFDSVPTIFITGQVNTYESKCNLSVRQKGFQETDIVSMVKDITKYAVQITSESDICYEFEKAYHIATSGRFGPVLIDIPMDVQRKEIDLSEVRHFNAEIENYSIKEITSILEKELNISKRPCILVGNGIKCDSLTKEFRELIKKINIPVVSSMPAFDVMLYDDENYFGFIGAYGNRCANFIVAKSDLIISIGSRLDSRQISTNSSNFAPNAKLIRFDIDKNEFENKVKDDEIQFLLPQKYIFDTLYQINKLDFNEWFNVCRTIKGKLRSFDDNKIKDLIKGISNTIPDNCVITTDVGQNQVWIAQYFENKPNQKILFSSSQGAMGFSLPAAIGAYYDLKKPVFAIMGDGGFQMNCQELEFIKREGLPIKIIVINNYALGMIRHFQEMYFNSTYTQTVKNNGYSSPNFEKISSAYDIPYYKISSEDQIDQDIFNNEKSAIIEVSINENTYVFPKLAMNKPPQDQEPNIDRELYNYIMKI